MGFFDFLMNLKILKDTEKQELSEEDEIVDLMYINEQIEKENLEKDKKD